MRVRHIASCLYAAALVASIVTWGVPLQTQLVLGWTVGALACASIGRPRAEVVQLVKDWAPLAAILLVYELSRGVFDSIGTPVHVTPMADIDRWLFGGEVPTVWLQERMWDPVQRHPWEPVFTIVYSTHFLAWLAVAGVLWSRSRPMFIDFTRRLLTLTFAGLATYIAFPAAPPWLASRMGEIGTVHRSTARGWEILGLHTAKAFERGQAVVNQVAAVPSLHAGFSALIALYFWPRARWYWRPLLVAYPLAMAFALVATGEHYVFDILLGWIYAAAVIAGWDRWDRRREAAGAEVPPAAAEEADAATAVPVSA